MTRRPGPESARVVGRNDGTTRFDRMRNGIDSGLEVMNLRTIQLPDGRRIRILTQPDPETMSQLLARPE